MKITTFADRQRHLRLLMEYAVREAQWQTAWELVERYASDNLALNRLENFYSYLPDGRDDAVTGLFLVSRRHGTSLLCAATLHDQYLYLVSADEAEYLGRLEEGIWDAEILDFFGYQDRQAFLKACASTDQIEEYRPFFLEDELCPVCSVSSGDHHTFGCPVELCPWCGGQLVACNCRFTQLGIEELDSERQLDDFLELLESQGRIPYDAKEHRPGYLDELPEEQ